MFIVFGIMIAGCIVGFLLRPLPIVKVNDRLIMGFIYLLLFLLGISVGGNQAILNNLGTLGWQALLLTFGAVAGSVFVGWWLYRRFFRDAEQKRENNRAEQAKKEVVGESENNDIE